MVELRRLATGVLAMALHVVGSHISWRKCQLSFELAGGSALLLWSGAMRPMQCAACGHCMVQRTNRQ